MLSWWERLHKDLVLIVDVQQLQDDGGDSTQQCGLSRIEEDWMLASATTTGVQQTRSQIAPLCAVLEDPRRQSSMRLVTWYREVSLVLKLVKPAS